MPILVRVFGAKGVISDEARHKENVVFAKLAQANIAPKFLARFRNGRVEAWRKARNLLLDEMRDPDVMTGVAKAMAAMHAFELNRNARPTLWNVVSYWIGRVRQLKAEKETFRARISSIDVDYYMCEFEQIKSLLSDIYAKSPIVFCHNDLLAGNILLSLDERREVSFVDFEYSEYNPRGFDIGNFFCEAMGGTIDGRVYPDKYPGKELQYKFCHAYLSVLDDNSDNRHAIKSLVEESNRYGLVSHLYWGFWALLQSEVSGIEFPYVDFARQRFLQYSNMKSVYLASYTT